MIPIWTPHDSDTGAPLWSKAREWLTGTFATPADVPPLRVANLWDDDASTLGTLSSSGNIIEHATNRVSPFLPVTGGGIYSSRAAITDHRVVWFTADQTAISGTDTDYQPPGEHIVWTAPANAGFVRIGTSQHALGGGIVFNAGPHLVDPADPDAPTGYWNDREAPPLHDGTVELRHLALPIAGNKISQEALDGAVPPKRLITNLFDLDTAEPGTLSTSGNVNEHESNVTSAFIAVTPEAPYVSQAVGLSRVVWYDSSQTAISGTDTDYIDPEVTRQWTAPTNAAFVRIGSNSYGGVQYGAIFNEGTELVDPENPVVAPSGFWDDREPPPVPGGGVGPEQLTETVQSEVAAAVGHIEPSTPTLAFTAVDESWDETQWLSPDGEVLYGNRGVILLQSTDEWATRQEVGPHLVGSIQAVRTTNDGELLASTVRDEDAGRKAKLFKSDGYDRTNPTAATWTEVLEVGATEANINNSWGLQVYENIVIASEYGLRGENGARRVWMSEDHGATFTLVFDQKTVVAPGRPAWTENGHVHTPAWDPYWSRLWVAVGDAPNTAVYYSDDKGMTWTFVEGSDDVQYTGIMPLPDVVLFGSDRAPNGLHAYRRGLKSDMPTIRPLLVLNADSQITHVFQLAFKRDWHPATPTYFAATPASGRGPTVITGTVDGKKGHVLWQADDGTAHIWHALGPTAQGNIVAAIAGDGITGYRVMKAPAPTWQRV